MLRHLPIPLITLTALAATAAVALGAPADPDRGFGRDGRVVIDFGGSDDAYAVAVQPDGKLVIAGDTSNKDDVIVARVNPDGSRDRGFGSDGIAVVESSGSEYGYAVALQPDGKILVAGHTSTGQNGVVHRLNTNGSPDKGFGTEGAAYLDSAGAEYLQAVAVQPDGKIVVAGWTTSNKDLAVYRLTAGGKPDNTFDDDGARGIDAGGEERAYGLALQADGKIVVAGYSWTTGAVRPLVARFGSTGTPDSSFGPDGWRKLDNRGILYGVAVQPDGQIVAAGEAGDRDDAGVYRLGINGLPDKGFGDNGVVGLDTGDSEAAYALALQPDGKIIVGGYTDAGDDGVVWRVNADGTPERGFGDDGALVVAGAGLEEVRGVAPQADGKIVFTGTKEGKDPDALLFRLLGDSTERQPGGGGGQATPGAVVRCAGKKATIVGTARRNVLRGTRGRDVIAARGGNDVVRGLGGNDVICGGAGRDRLLGGAGRDRLVGGPGRDRLIGGPGRDRMR